MALCQLTIMTRDVFDSIRKLLRNPVTTQLTDFLQIVFAAYCGIGFVVQKDSCIHQWNVRLIDVIEFGRVSTFSLLSSAGLSDAQIANAGTTVYSINQLFIKLSILQQFLHIFVPNRNKLYYLTHFIIWCNVLFYIAIALVTIFQCTYALSCTRSLLQLSFYYNFYRQASAA